MIFVVLYILADHHVFPLFNLTFVGIIMCRWLSICENCEYKNAKIERIYPVLENFYNSRMSPIPLLSGTWKYS